MQIFLYKRQRKKKNKKINKKTLTKTRQKHILRMQKITIMDANNYFRAGVVFILSVFCILSGIVMLQKQKEKDNPKFEVQAVGVFDRVGCSLDWVEVTTGEIAKKKEGIFLVGDSELYSISNLDELSLEPGDSVYVVNHAAYSSIPSKEQVLKQAQKAASTAKVIFCILLILWGFSVVSLILGRKLNNTKL